MIKNSLNNSIKGIYAPWIGCTKNAGSTIEWCGTVENQLTSCNPTLAPTGTRQKGGTIHGR